MISKEEYKEQTGHLNPVISCNNNTSLSWFEDYYVGGKLLRYSGTIESDAVRVVDLLSEDNIQR